MDTSNLHLQPLYDALSRTPFSLQGPEIDAFLTLQRLMMSSPALGLPNYTCPFILFCHEVHGHAQGVLTQDHGGKQPIIPHN